MIKRLCIYSISFSMMTFAVPALSLSHTYFFFRPDKELLTLGSQDVLRQAAYELGDKQGNPFMLEKPWLGKDDQMWKELDMHLIAEKLDHTITLAGKVLWPYMLQPIADPQKLEERRGAFQTLLADTSLRENLTSVLTEYREREDFLVDLLSNESAIDKYFATYKIQEKSTADYIPPYLVQAYHTSKHALLTYTIYYTLAASYRAEFRPLATELWHWRQNGIRQGMRNIGPLLLRAPIPLFKTFFLGLFTFFSGKSFFDKLFFHDDIKPKELYKFLISLRKIIVNLEQLSQLPAECSIVHKALSQWHNALDETSSTYDAKLARLVALLRTNFFSYNALDDSGLQAALTTGLATNISVDVYNYALQCKEKLLSIMHAYGAADSYLSVVRLYQEHQQSQTPISWVTFAGHQQPYYLFEEIWHPLVPYNETVTNNIELGSPGAHHMLLTGPHGCGKTTIMRSIATNYILAQSTLFILGSRGVVTPLTKIGVYLNIKDALARGISSFMAEKQKMTQLYQLAKGLSDNDICLLLIDEPYAKTLQATGSGRVYSFMQELYQIPQVMIILATHFAQPAVLEQETQGNIKNYQPELLELQPGVFTRTFKMLEGGAEWWFNDTDGKRTRFIEWLKNLTNEQIAQEQPIA
jgi:MutS domain V